MSAPRKKAEYKRVAERAKEGDLSGLIEPFDYLLLEALPDEGTNVGGLYQVGSTVRQLAKDFSKMSGEPISTTLIASRMVSLKYHKLARGVKLVSQNRGGNAWQRTVYGKEVAEQWRASQTSTEA